MAIIVMVYGHSGSGKSTSLRNFKEKEVGIINVSGKPLPFRNKHDTYKTDDYVKIDTALRKSPAKSIVVDDATYLMTNEFMRTSEVTGFQKFTVMAKNFWALINAAAALPDDKIVYFMGHIDLDANGNEKFKTIGKLLDEKVTLEGLFTIVLKTAVTDGKYTFQTQTNGNDTAKSPFGMFEEKYIDNDLKAVDDAIRDYYQIKEIKEEQK
jgi:hypothetical protein